MNDAQVRARWALLFGNFVIGTGVLAPAGLINELSSAFSVDVPKAGSLIGYGAAVLCIEAPLLAFLTNRVHPTRANTKLAPMRARVHDAVVEDFENV